MARREVGVFLAVDEQNGNVAGGYRVFWRGLIEIYAVFQARIEEAGFHGGAQQGAAQQRAGVQLLAEAVVGGFAEAGEGRLRNDGAETRLGAERVEQLRGSHGFAEAVDAVRCFGLFDPIEPATNVLSFFHAVCGDCAVAQAVGAGIGKQDSIAVTKQEIGAAEHAGAVVGDTV